MDDCGRQLQHARLQGPLGTHLNGDSDVVGKRIRQHVKLFPINSDLLGPGEAEFLDLVTYLVNGNSAVAGMQESSLPAAKKTASRTAYWMLFRDGLP